MILLGLNLAADVLGLKSQDLVIKNWDDGEYVRGFLIDERAIGPIPSDKNSAGICSPLLAQRRVIQTHSQAEASMARDLLNCFQQASAV